MQELGPWSGVYCLGQCMVMHKDWTDLGRGRARPSGKDDRDQKWVTASICSLFDAYVISLHQHFSSPKGFTSILTLPSPDPSQCLMQCLVLYTRHASISYLDFCALTLYTERCQGIQTLHQLHPVALQEGSQELSLGNASSSLFFSSRMWSFEAPIVRSWAVRGMNSLLDSGTLLS